MGASCDACICSTCHVGATCLRGEALCLSCMAEGYNSVLTCMENLYDGFVLAVFGTRTMSNWLRQQVWRVMSLIAGKHPAMRVVSGGCSGVDLYALEWCIKTGHPIKVFLPSTLEAHPWPEVRDWLEMLPREWLIEQPQYGPADLKTSAPYLERDVKIALKCTHALAFPTKDSRGTWYTAQNVQKLEKPIAIYDVDLAEKRIARRKAC